MAGNTAAMQCPACPRAPPAVPPAPVAGEGRLLPSEQSSLDPRRAGESPVGGRALLTREAEADQGRFRSLYPLLAGSASFVLT